MLDDARTVLAAAPRTEALAERLPDPNDLTPIRIALVGPYNAGKSLLIGAVLRMTSDQVDAMSSALPHTTEMTPHKWGDYLLLDLPGTLSGFEDHDSEARRGVRTAD